MDISAPNAVVQEQAEQDLQEFKSLPRHLQVGVSIFSVLMMALAFIMILPTLQANVLH